MRHASSITSLTIAAAAALAALAAPRQARACGGTFCDAGPTSMPVDQTGENIVFVMGEGFTEAHIQITYDPTSDAEKFAWVIPLMEIPEFAVGSQPLFDRVLSGTVPAYGFTSQFTGEGCGDTGGAFGTSGADGTGGGGDSSGGAGGPEIVLQEIVGAFEITVLQGGTADELVLWLDDNGYQQDPAALPIFDEYLGEGYRFAAFKLVNDAEVADIHPVVLRFPVEEACVPLRLTRIAAVEDMEVRTFFLADDRVVPRNYRHVLINPLKLSWPTYASNYREVITLAVDAQQANGHAFVTEYAGPTDMVSRFGIWSDQWSSNPFEFATPIEAIDRLKVQGLLQCFNDFGDPQCDFRHPLLRNLMLQYLPVPVGAVEAEFYDCPECFAAEIDQAAWDGPAFAGLLDERIIVPGMHAVTLLDAYPTLTRMYTTISPGEMTEDPFFHQNPDLPDVDLTNEVATRRFGCGSHEVWVLPDGREVFVPNGIWPDFDEQMPWEEEVQEIAMAGAPISLSSQTEVIGQELFAHNCSWNYPSAEACGNEGGSGTGGTMGGETEGSAGLDGQLDDGCGCRTRSPGGGGAMVLGLGLLGLGLGSRRRRR